MENYTNGPEDQNRQDRWREQHDNMGSRERELMHHWKKKMWHKMKLGQQKVATMLGGDMDEEAKMRMMKGVGVAAAVGFVLGILIGKGSRKR